MKKTIYSTDYQNLTTWLKEQRLSQSLSMRDLASRMEVPHSFIGKIEQCERRLDIIEYLDYCKALEVNPKDGIDLLIK